MKRNYILSGIILYCMCLFTACNDFLDTLPDNRTELDSEEKIRSLLVSAYPSRLPVLINEIASDNTMDNGSLYTFLPGCQEIEEAYYWREFESTSYDSPLGLWRGCYSAIAAANEALAAIEEMGNPASLNPHKAEALLCRAYGHFILVNIFSNQYNTVTSSSDMGIPYSLSPEDEVFVEYERGTVSETYELINKDIEAALPLVDDNLYIVPKYHFNMAAAYAFATRFNLYYCKFDKVIEYATKAIGEDPSSKLRDFSELVTASGADDRGNIYIDATKKCNLMLLPLVSSWPYAYLPYGYYRYAHTREISEGETLWSDSPYRSYLVLTSLNGNAQSLSMAKLIMYFEYTDKTGNTGIRHMVNTAFTVEETLLCRAEAYIHKNDFDNATRDLGIWMTTHATSRAPILTREKINEFYGGFEPMPTVPETAADRNPKKKLNPKGFTIAEGEQENFIQCLLHFRRQETIHEGLRWYDIRRYGIEISHNREGTTADILTVDDPRRTFQLPSDIISAGLTANPR